jgi:NADH dehydrogenase FAD-containing subunit
MKQIVIIGGGFAGTRIARKLERQKGRFAVTLIDCKGYFEFTPGILRTIVQPSHIRSIQKRHAHYLKNTEIIEGEVTAIEEKGDTRNVMVDKRKIPFDYCIIASGSRYALPIKSKNAVKAGRAKELWRFHHRLSMANDVLIIGGGLAGVELAAEIATHYSQKNIRLAEAGKRLMQRQHEKSAAYATRFLEKHNVTILTDTIIKAEKDTFYAGKEKIEADIVFICTGIKPNSAFLDENMLDEKGYVIVDDQLCIKGHERLFAAGDITAIKEEKTAQNAEHQADVVVENIIAKETGNDLAAYESHSKGIVISLGKYHGIFEKGSFVLTGFIPAIMKAGIERFEIIKRR